MRPRPARSFARRSLGWLLLHPADEFHFRAKCSSGSNGFGFSQFGKVFRDDFLKNFVEQMDINDHASVITRIGNKRQRTSLHARVALSLCLMKKTATDCGIEQTCLRFVKIVLERRLCEKAHEVLSTLPDWQQYRSDPVYLKELDRRARIEWGCGFDLDRFRNGQMPCP
jgi:hypothetical protein